jgi:malonyl-CoA O-methyltransferase
MTHGPLHGCRPQAAEDGRDLTDADAGRSCFEQRACHLQAIDHGNVSHIDRMDRLATSERHAFNLDRIQAQPPEVMPVFLRRKPKPPSHQRAMDWFKAHMVPGQGIIVHTRQPVPYPEVTGYWIPTLYQWGETGLARTCTRWLLSIQLPSGAFPAPDGVPYTFDTGQIMRGLCAAIDDVPGARESLRRAADWMLTQVEPGGRMTTPSTELWTGIASDLIHTYALPPLLWAGQLLGEKKYEDATRFVLDHYKRQPELVPFNRLSHFHAYAMEALTELGEMGLARQGMADVARVQRRDGSIPAYPDVEWVCSTGMAQYAIVWYVLGERERADRAMAFLEKIQNPSGGFFGSYGKGAKYIAGGEISWANKYFLDAWRLKRQAAEAAHA